MRCILSLLLFPPLGEGGTGFVDTPTWAHLRSLLDFIWDLFGFGIDNLWIWFLSPWSSPSSLFWFSTSTNSSQPSFLAPMGLFCTCFFLVCPSAIHQLLSLALSLALALSLSWHWTEPHVPHLFCCYVLTPSRHVLCRLRSLRRPRTTCFNQWLY